MFTRNFYNLSLIEHSSYDYNKTYLKILDGSIVKWKSFISDTSYSDGISVGLTNRLNGMYDFASNLNLNMGNNTFTDIAFGSSDTPESVEDYTLDFISTANVEYKGFSFTPSISGNRVSYSYTKTMQNNKNEAIVIKELGLIGCIGVWSNYSKGFLAYRKVLDTPIIVQPGEIFTIELSIGSPE